MKSARARPNDPQRWNRRPWIARSLQLLSLIVPIACSLVAAYIFANLVPPADGTLEVLARFVLIATLSTLVLIGVERLARRLLPLIALLDLTLLFPDRAPSRFQIAIRNGTTAQLKKRIREFDSAIGDTEPGAAAQRLLGLVAALSAHDRLTRGHSERVRAYAQMIAAEMAMDTKELDQLRWSALLHDIGKLRIDSAILNKPGRLTADEFEIIKQHPTIGAGFVAPLAGWLGDSVRAVAEHHERWDGNGYPRGLAGNNISFAARVVAVADSFDVMTSARSYKRPQSAAAARRELARCSGTQFDPNVVRAFLNVSLGRLWFTMGPVSWLAQASLVPRTVTAGLNGSSTALATVGGLAVSGLVVLPDLPVAPPAVVEAAPPDQPRFDTLGAREPMIVVSRGPDAATTTSTASPPSTTIATSPPSDPTPTTSPNTSAPSTTSPVAPPTVTVPATTPITVPPAVTVPPLTLAPLVTGAEIRLRLAASAAGDTPSTQQLSLVTREPLNATVPNLDTNRNSDPGLTLRRPGAFNNSDGPTIQRFRYSPLVPLVVGPSSVTLYVAPKGFDSDTIEVSVALYSCALLTGCTQIASSTQTFIGIPNQFTAMQLDLGNPNRLIGLTSQLELRIVIGGGSTDDAWIAFDSLGHVSELVIG